MLWLFHCCCVVFSLLLELASAFTTQIPSDKLKTIDSESKMETAPRGAGKCPPLVSTTQAHVLSASMCTSARTATSSAILNPGERVNAVAGVKA